MKPRSLSPPVRTQTSEDLSVNSMINFKKKPIDDFAPDKDLVELLAVRDVHHHSPLTNKEDSALEFLGVKLSNQGDKHCTPCQRLV